MNEPVKTYVKIMPPCGHEQVYYTTNGEDAMAHHPCPKCDKHQINFCMGKYAKEMEK